MHTGHWPVAATIALSALAFSAIALAQPCYPEFFGRLRADDGAPGDQLGTSIAYSGHALLGAPGDDVFGPRSGSAYIFHQDYEDLRWYSTARPVPRNGQPGAEFGFSVAGTTDRAVIGAPKTDVAFNNDGAASFFIREYSDWSERLVLTASDPHPGSRFGHAVAMTFFSNLRLAIIGAPGTPRNGQPVGVVYISIVEFGWGEVARLEPDDLEPGDVFGSWVAVSNNIVVVGAPQSNSAGEDSGAAYGYRYVNDVWQFESKLIASDATAGDNFAAAALVTPGFILIGAPRADGMNTESGAVYDFRFDGNQWIQQDKLVAADGRTGDLFGASLDYADFKPRATIGAPGTDERGPNSGAVYLFRPVGDAWVEAAKVLPAPDSQNRYFGSAVAADRELLVVGQPRADDAGPDSRRASAYDTNWFTLELDGNCPGELTVSWQGARANGQLVIGYGDRRETWQSPYFGPCGGVIIGIRGRTQLVDPPGHFSSQDGRGSISGHVSRWVCGAYLQLLESGICEVSNVAQIPQ